MAIKKVLFITYDGLTDPLGQSQILPYIKGISDHEYVFTVLSFEKPDRFAKLKSSIEATCIASNITWHPILFHSGIPILSKMYDRWLMKKNAKVLYQKHQYDIVHCRSYISSEVGLWMKQKYGTKFIFDMRGFWADEKKDGGNWNVKNPLFNYVYHHYKQKEKQYIQQANAIVSLTHAGKTEIETWAFYKSETPIYVIPCSVDTNLFACRKNNEKQDAKINVLGIDPSQFVLSYLGAIGTWYCLPQMLQLFQQILLQKKDALFLIISQTPKQIILDQVVAFGIAPHQVMIKEVGRQDVPKYMAATDVNVSFIAPVYSKISSSPTKLGEVLAMGIPVITNSGVGDVKQIVAQIDGGIVIDNFEEKTLQQCALQIDALMHKDGQQISNETKKILSLDLAIHTYKKLYNNL
jgi:glycosyltransferase involved in cell wall biosynthesis